VKDMLRDREREKRERLKGTGPRTVKAIFEQEE
jgi:hypothetical protein